MAGAPCALVCLARLLRARPQPPWSFPSRVDSSKVRCPADCTRREAAMEQILLRNFRMLDPERDELVGGCEILVEGERIREVSERPIRAPQAAAVDCGGR